MSPRDPSEQPTVRRAAVDGGRPAPLAPRRPHEPARRSPEPTSWAGGDSAPWLDEAPRWSGDGRERGRRRPHQTASETPHASARADEPRRRPVPMILVLLLAALGAAALGYMGQKTSAGTFRGSWEFSRLGGPWLLAGFLGGAIGGWRRGWSGLVLGVVVGAVLVGAGSVVYYGISWYSGGQNAHRAAKLGIGWGAAGVAIGGVLGLLGALSSTTLARHRPKDGGRPEGSWLHGAAFGTLGGLLIGEAIALLWVWHTIDLRAMAMLEGAAGAALVLFGSVIRSWRFFVSALLFAAISASVAPVATTAVRETLRTIGWAGA